MSYLKNKLLNLAHILLALGLFHLQIYHTRTVFENETKYSHLTRIERESLFTGEHAMYYSFYKTIVEAPNFTNGLKKLMYNNLTDYPETINILHQFHIFPEVVIGFFYKQFLSLSQSYNVRTNVCRLKTNEFGSDLIIDCDGLADPMNFYLESIWLIGGSIVIFLYFYAIYLSDNILGGIAAVAFFFCIHNHGTRMHTIPAARENFAMPFILLHMFYLTVCIHKQHQNFKTNCFNAHLEIPTSLILTSLSLIASLSWQFTTFIFTTQTIIMFILLEANQLKPGLVYEYGLSHFSCNILAANLTFDNYHFVLCIHQPILLLLYLYVQKKYPNTELIESNGNAMPPPPLTSPPTIRTIIISKSINILNWLYNKIPSSLLIISWFRYVMFLIKYTDINDFHIIYLDIIMTKLKLWKVSVDTLINLRSDQLSFIDWKTIQAYNSVFFSKIFAIFIVVHLSKWLQFRQRKLQSTTPTNDTIERAKNYLIEDFLEENKITIQDLVNPSTDKQLTQCLNQLKECKYNYELYRQLKLQHPTTKLDERTAFLNDVKRFKEEIKGSHNDVHITRNDETNDSSNNTTNNSETSDNNDNNIDCDEQNVKPEIKDEKLEEELKAAKPFVQTYYLFNVMQTIVFISMTCFAVKLKFLLSPILCVMASTYPSRNWFKKAYHLYWIIYILTIVFSLADPGIRNLNKQHQPKEYKYNEEFANLIHWIKINTDETAVFASPSNIITTVMLSTNRPIVNHPRNEYPSIRKHNRLVYSILSKQNYNNIYKQLKKLKAEYIILTHQDCFSELKNLNYKITDFWDIIEPENQNNNQLCAELFQDKNITNFIKVFASKNYLILKLLTQSVELEFKQMNLKEFSI